MLKHSKNKKNGIAKKPETAPDMVVEMKDTMTMAKNMNSKAIKTLGLVESGYASYQKMVIVEDMRKEILAMTDPVKKMTEMKAMYAMINDAQLRVLEAKKDKTA